MKSIETAPKPDIGFRKILEGMAQRHDLGRVFEGFARLSACALAVQTREAEYLAEAKHWDKAELQQFAQALGALTLEMESHPFEDRLGRCYLEFALSSQGQQWKGEFHTPKTVCDLIGALTLGDVEALPANGPITICEPACGAGAMILSLAANCPPEMRRRLRVTAVDINRTACDMTFINTTLWGVATRVIHGDSLGMKYWAAWSNIHHLSPAFPMAGQALSSAARGQGHPPTEAEVEQLKAALSQQMLVWD